MLISEPLLEPMFEASPHSDQIESNSDQETKEQLGEKTPSSWINVLNNNDEVHETVPFRTPTNS